MIWQLSIRIQLLTGRWITTKGLVVIYPLGGMDDFGLVTIKFTWFPYLKFQWFPPPPLEFNWQSVFYGSPSTPCWQQQILPRDPSPHKTLRLPPPPVIDNDNENLMVYLTPLIQTTTWPLGHHTPPYSIQGLQPIKHVSWGMLGARQYLCRRPRGRKKCECRVHLKTDKLQG